MQQQQQGGGGASAPQSQYGVPPQPQPQQQAAGMMAPPAALTTHMLLGGGGDQSQQQLVVEEASPISSRPPATATASPSGGSANLDELMGLSSGGGADDDGLGLGEEADRAGGIASGNRWPRQETLALLQIRSEMDAVFRDATLKGPLWEDVSRKLAELGYKRSAKKCKEKFENVHKYYKRTKEGRAGRQDGKSYRFFTQLEALHNTTPSSASAMSAPPSQPPPPSTSSLDVAPVSVGIPMNAQSSSLRIHQPQHHPPPQPASTTAPPSMFPADHFGPTGTSVGGISFSSDGTSSSRTSEDDDDEEELLQQPSSRKRKRESSSKGGETRRMMDFFEGLMKQVMQKQETMQQRFLEAIEKREQDRMIRDEAWKRQEMARLSREHELMAQERAISASRDAAIVSFLQKITGQTIQLPSPVVIPVPFSRPPPPPPAQAQPQPVTIAPLVTATVQTSPAPAPPQQQPQTQLQPRPQPARKQQPPQQDRQQQEQQRVHLHHHSSISSDAIMAIPEQQVQPHEMMGSGEPASSRWPKAEVLALIKLRSGLESRYQENGPKGPLWEEISAGMQRMGYKRNSKRCKEKWENINKYFKKVKESNKKRPEDAKTCPYFHELDALYRRKSLPGGSNSSGTGFIPTQNRLEEQQQQHKQLESTKLDPPPPPQTTNTQEMMQTPQHFTQGCESQNKNGGGTNALLQASLFGEGNSTTGAAKEPEDIVKELMTQQGTQQLQQLPQQLTVSDYDKIEGADSDRLDDEDEEEDGLDIDDEDDDDDELQEERKMAYKIEFQRQNTTSAASNGGGGNGAPSFLAMVQ